MAYGTGTSIPYHTCCGEHATQDWSGKLTYILAFVWLFFFLFFIILCSIEFIKWLFSLYDQVDWFCLWEWSCAGISILQTTFHQLYFSAFTWLFSGVCGLLLLSILIQKKNHRPRKTNRSSMVPLPLFCGGIGWQVIFPYHSSPLWCKCLFVVYLRDSLWIAICPTVL